MSFVWATFLAISFGWILRHPLALILVYLGCILGGQVMTLLGAAKDEAAKGNVVGAAILAGLGVYLLAWANRIKRAEI
ncbi:MAG: hypothetical protein DRI26_09705 [Chloroflexi bacterium]|nr:MAG: hypothetical protein DRI26_09705 [Chloroflexota bacterium]